MVRPASQTPTQAQQQVLRFLLESETAGGRPTYREIATALGWKAVGTVRDHVQALARHGLVSPSRQARGLRLTEAARVLFQGAGSPGSDDRPASVDGGVHAALDVLAPYFVRRRFRAGTLLWNTGDAARSVVVIERGRAKVFRTLPNGKMVVLFTLGPGDVFGFLPFLDGGTYPASVMALDDLETRVMSREALHRALREDPRVALVLIEFLGRRLRDTMDKIEQLSQRGLLPRVAAALVALLPEQPRQGLLIIELSVSSADFAASIDMAPESLSRGVTQLVAMGILHRLGPRRLQVLAAERLREAARASEL